MTTAVGPWTYDWQDRPRPFVHPVRTPAGHTLSVDAPSDHPWHHGLWFTIKFVNGENFWEEYGEFGTLRQSSAPVVTDLGADATRADSRLDWVRPDGTTVVATETCRLTHRPVTDGSALDWDVRFEPAVEVELDRTPFTTWGGYGGLTLRGRPDWHDTRLRLPDGADRDRVLGERAPWCALDGLLDDGAAGVVLLDHPENRGHPVPWYASTRSATYGDEGWSNFVNAAFLWDGPVTLAAAEALHLRYRVIVHDDEWDLDRLTRAWTDWTDPIEGNLPP